MKPPVETVRVSERGRDILIKLKRRTGIEHWNVLCRWALVESLAKPKTPELFSGSPDSNIEIKWNTFGGELSEVYSLMMHLSQQSSDSVRSKLSLQEYFKAHLERGLLLLQKREDLTSLLTDLPTSQN